jgi:hypothetical protein
MIGVKFKTDVIRHSSKLKGLCVITGQTAKEQQPNWLLGPRPSKKLVCKYPAHTAPDSARFEDDACRALPFDYQRESLL